MTRLKPSLRACFALALASALLAAGLVLWFKQRGVEVLAKVKQPDNGAPQVLTPNLREPAEDFSTFLYVLQTGGCEITRPAAIAWLDRYVRDQVALPKEESSRVMTMIEKGGHPSWEKGYRQHIFNSAFNALHYCKPSEPFIRELERLALGDPDQTMQLYALQHLGMLRRIGQLIGPLAEQIHSTVENLAKQKDSHVSGTAIQLLADWDGVQGDQPLAPNILQLALATAADTERSVDIRVSAIHSAGPAALEIARTMAKDASQPIMLRKAAIARIGEDGGPEDIEQLSLFSQEGSRIAQATQPAINAIRDRMTRNKPAKLVPYQ